MANKMMWLKEQISQYTDGYKSPQWILLKGSCFKNFTSLSLMADDYGRF